MSTTSTNLQPTLNGDLLSLRPLRAQDFEALYLCASDPQIWEQHPQPDRYKREVFQKFFESALESKGALIAYDRGSDLMVGCSRFYGMNLDERRITIGYTFLRKENWGGLYNRELKTLMLSHAFEFFDHVRFEIGENNIRSRRAIEKIGAVLLNRVNLDNGPYVLYQIDKTQFKFGT